MELPIRMDANGTTANGQHVGGDGDAVIEVMRRQQLLLQKLEALAIPLLRDDDPSAELVVHLLQDVVCCNISVISQLGRGNMYHMLPRPSVRESAIHNRNVAREQRSFSRRRRKQNPSRSLVTDTPHYDGHQWRKYGQKYINGMKHPRCYYRCTYSKEQNCKAAKTIQKMGKGDLSSRDNSTQYTVVYYGNHTCTSNCHNVDLTYSYTARCDHRNIFPGRETKDDAMDPELAILLNEFTDIPLDPHWGINQIVSPELLQC